MISRLCSPSAINHLSQTHLVHWHCRRLGPEGKLTSCMLSQPNSTNLQKTDTVAMTTEIGMLSDLVKCCCQMLYQPFISCLSPNQAEGHAGTWPSSTACKSCSHMWIAAKLEWIETILQSSFPDPYLITSPHFCNNRLANPSHFRNPGYSSIHSFCFAATLQSCWVSFCFFTRLPFQNLVATFDNLQTQVTHSFYLPPFLAFIFPAFFSLIFFSFFFSDISVFFTKDSGILNCAGHCPTDSCQHSAVSISVFLSNLSIQKLTIKNLSIFIWLIHETNNIVCNMNNQIPEPNPTNSHTDELQKISKNDTCSGVSH